MKMTWKNHEGMLQQGTSSGRGGRIPAELAAMSPLRRLSSRHITRSRANRDALTVGEPPNARR